MASPLTTTPAPNPPEDELGRRLDEIRAIIDRIQTLHRILAEQGDPGGDEEAELLRCLETRDRLATELGFFLIRWLAGGGSLELVPGRDPDPPVQRVGPTDTIPPDPSPPDPPAAPASVPPAQPGPGHPPSSDPPPADEPPPPAPAAPAATAAALEALSRQGLGPKWSAQRSAGDQQRALRSILQQLGRPSLPRQKADVRRLLDALQHAVGRMDTWQDQPKRAQRHLLGLLSSLAKQLQASPPHPLPTDQERALSALFSRMSRWSKTHQPGFVPGLSRDLPPDHGGWLEDARFHWDRLEELARPATERPDSPEALLRELENQLVDGIERDALLDRVRTAIDAGLSQSDRRLVELLLPHHSAILGAPGLKTLKGKLRTAFMEEDARQASEDATTRIPDDWPLFSRTKGLKTVIVGGDPRPEATRRIQGAFRLGPTSWEPCDQRRVEALARRIRQGNVDLVLLLRRFLSHTIQDLLLPACAEAQIPAVLVDTGYGVVQVRRALERSFGLGESP